MNFRKTIKIAMPGKMIGKIDIYCQIMESHVEISYIDSFGQKGDLRGSDFFRLLSKLRHQYIKKNMDLLCAGGLLDVFPGGLVSDSSHGEFAYKMDFGTGKRDVVNIFSSIGIESYNLLSSYSEQKKYRKWSINRSRG